MHKNDYKITIDDVIKNNKIKKMSNDKNNIEDIKNKKNEESKKLLISKGDSSKEGGNIYKEGMTADEYMAACHDKYEKDQQKAISNINKKKQLKNSNKKNNHIKIGNNPPGNYNNRMINPNKIMNTRVEDINKDIDLNINDSTVGKGLRIMALGGLGEIGSNMYIYETKDELLVVDCGGSIAKEDEKLLGAENAVADFRYVIKNKHKLVGIILTHAHDDHISGLKSLLRYVKTNIYGGQITLMRTLSIINGGSDLSNDVIQAQDKISKKEHSVWCDGNNYILVHDKYSENISKDFNVSFFKVNHSITDAFGIIIKSQNTNIVHTGDYKIEKDPLYEKSIDFKYIQGVLAETHGESSGKASRKTTKKGSGNNKQTILLSDSTNSIKKGRSVTEREVKDSLSKLFEQYKNKNIIISCFSTSSHRIRTIIDLANKYNKKIVYCGGGFSRVMAPIYKKTGIKSKSQDVSDTLCVICTGSQGEDGSFLDRAAKLMQSEKDKDAIISGIGNNIEHSSGWQLKREGLFLSDFKPIDKQNTVIIMAANPIPGNERKVNKLVSSFELRGYTVIQNKDVLTHASGHGYEEEIREMIKKVNPDVFIPMHGELIHQLFSERIAEELGIKRTIILENGEFVTVYDDVVRKCSKKEKIIINPSLIKQKSFRIMNKNDRLKEAQRFCVHDYVYVISKHFNNYNLVATIKISETGDYCFEKEIAGALEKIKRPSKRINEDVCRIRDYISSVTSEAPLSSINVVGYGFLE